jgi:hypothetical protein
VDRTVRAAVLPAVAALLAATAMMAPRPGDPEIGAFVPPALGRCYWPDDLATCPFRWYWGRWATVTAHFDGPVARTCRIASQPPGAGETNGDAVAWCRAQLIVLGVGPLEPPETAATAAAPEGGAWSARSATIPCAAAVLGLLLVAGSVARRRPRAPL